ncbi:MAG: hypothetical protein V2B18_06685 [Pseudomonadota bacterium]
MSGRRKTKRGKKGEVLIHPRNWVVPMMRLNTKPGPFNDRREKRLRRKLDAEMFDEIG